MNNTIALTNVELVTSEGIIPDGVLIITGSEISAAGPAGKTPLPSEGQRFNLPGRRLLPGFIDLHTHGLLGKDVFGRDLDAVIQRLPRHGVTAFLAATFTLPLAEVHQRLQDMVEVLHRPPRGAQCLGIHLESNFLSPKCAGMANPLWMEPLTLQKFDSLQESAGGFIRMITLAPEECQGLQIISELVERGVIVSIGHSNASYEQVVEAVQLGLSHATHTFNGMPAFHHREPGVVGAVLLLEDVTAELIADGHHVHPAAMRLLLKAKGKQRVCLVSDSSPLADLPKGRYSWHGHDLIVDGNTCRTSGGQLAGSCAQMDTGYRNLIRLAGLTASEASVCASRVPAKILEPDSKKGCLLPGNPADLVVLDQNQQVEITIVRGEVIWRRDQQSNRFDP